MMRRIDNKTILDKFAEVFCAVVEKHVKYFICSGFVSIAHGRSRATEDIDMIIDKISEGNFIQLHNDLVNAGFECMQSSDAEIIYNDYLIEGSSVRYTLKDEFLPEM